METPLYHQQDWLYNQYVIQGKSSHKIAKENNVSCTIILKWLKKNNILPKSHNDINFRDTLNEKHLKYRNKEWLEECYFNKKMTWKKIAEQITEESGIKITEKAIWGWKDRMKIRGKNRYTRTLHHNWKGGRHFNKRSGTWILNIDSKPVYEYRYMVEQELGRKLFDEEVVHHINGDRSDNRKENLYLFSTDSLHQLYHQKLMHYILQNIHKKNINLDKNWMIKKTNLIEMKSNKMMPLR